MAIPVLDLLNFESDVAEGCEYVLTSPRSLQACAEIGIKPIQLLKVTFNELVAERPDLSVKEARDYLIELNEARNEQLQSAIVARRAIMNGQKIRKRSTSGPTKPKKTKSEPSVNDKKLPTPTRSVSSPHVSDPVSLTPMGEAVLKSHSLPPSVISSARGKIRQTRQNDKLIDSMLKKYSDRKLEIQKARAHWRRWQEEKVKLQEEKIEETKSVQRRVAQNRREFELNNLIMNGKREDEWSKELVKREQKIKAKMKRAEVNAQYHKLEKEARIRENMELERRKKESQAERLRHHERAQSLKEKEIAINLDKRLTEAEKTRKIKHIRDAENLHRRNVQTRKNFEETHNEVVHHQMELNKQKEMELSRRLDQAKRNNGLLMQQRSTAIRVAAERKSKQIEEVQAAREAMLREQRAKLEEETRRNELLAAEALKGASKMKLKKLEEAKEKHIHERLRFQENLDRSKVEFESEKKRLENQISLKLHRQNQIARERERTILISKMRAQKEGVRRDVIRAELESFDEKAKRAQLFAQHIERR